MVVLTVGFVVVGLLVVDYGSFKLVIGWWCGVVLTRCESLNVIDFNLS